MKQELGLNSPESFFYLSQSKCTTVDGVDDAKGFEDVCKAMTVIEVSPSDQVSRDLDRIKHLFKPDKNFLF
jgi:myosin-1